MFGNSNSSARNPKFEAIRRPGRYRRRPLCGHGIEIGGVKLPGSGRRAAGQATAMPKTRRSARTTVSSADGAKRLRLIVLDACRDILCQGDAPGAEGRRAARVVAGLGKVEPTQHSIRLICLCREGGSTADDGDGPGTARFTTAVLSNLTVPGLDVRLAFGRVRDEVLRVTASRQEPFVYGRRGGNIALVAGAAVVEAPDQCVKQMDELVQIDSARSGAWEVFLGHPPHRLLCRSARAQIEALNNEGNVNLAALPQPREAKPRHADKRVSLEWDRVKDATDLAALQKFIRPFPDFATDGQRATAMDLLNGRREREQGGARGAGGGAQGRGRNCSARRRQRRAEDRPQRRSGRRRAPCQGGGSRAEGEGRGGEAQGCRSKAKGRAGRTGSRRRGSRSAARGERATGQGAEAEAEAKLPRPSARRTEERAPPELEAAAAKATSEKQAREAEEARKKLSLPPQGGRVQGRTSQVRANHRQSSEGSGIGSKSLRQGPHVRPAWWTVVATLIRCGRSRQARGGVAQFARLGALGENEPVRLGCFSGKADDR